MGLLFGKKSNKKAELSKEEIDWLNQYHQRVYNLLAPQLDYDERYWLANATSAL